MSPTYRIRAPHHPSFARTNVQTISQRVSLIRELLPGLKSIAEICCGDCSNQHMSYHETLPIDRYAGLDLQLDIVSANRNRGIECYRGDALDAATIQKFINFDLIFFGPPLSVDCDGHNLLSFREVVPGYIDFAQLLLQVLGYHGTLVCICPRDTSLGDIQWLYQHIKKAREDFGLRLIHFSYSTLTGAGIRTELRLKYQELWFSDCLDDLWEIRESKSN